MSSKVTFRARMVDSARPLSIFKAEELPDITDINNMGRSVLGQNYLLRLKKIEITFSYCKCDALQVCASAA